MLSHCLKPQILITLLLGLSLSRPVMGQGADAKFFLNDPQGLINDEFSVPEPMTERVAFWFDVYTKYDSQTHIIHHSRFPWIVFKVVDTTPILDSDKGHYWTRYHRARRLVATERSRIHKTLLKLARRKNLKNLGEDEASLVAALADLPGPRKTVFQFAASNLRTQIGQRDFFVGALENSRRYLDYMEEEFNRIGLPAELTRIPFVESSFNERAQSKVGASGIWQIMPRTGKSFLTVDTAIDERNSPLKATRAAAEVLKRYNRQFDSWPLSITAYNHGIGSLQKAIRSVKSRELPVIIDRYHRGSFKFASSNFYSCFLAALHAEKYHDKIFKDGELRKQPLLVREVIYLSRKMRTKNLIETVGLSPDEFIKYNLDLRDALKSNSWLPKGFEIHLPEGQSVKLNGGLADSKSDNLTPSRSRSERAQESI